MALAVYLTVALGLILVLDPIPQDPAYHRFADQRALLGLPHAGDVLSNLAFLAVGGAGLLLLAGPGRRRAFAEPGEHRPMVVFFTGMLLTAIGSAWYHLRPDNAGLLVDRLCMIPTTAGFVAAVVEDRFRGLGRRLLWPLAGLGLVSVLWWGWTEHLGRGDLRLYGLFQFGPVLPVLALIVWRPSRYSGAGWYVVGLVLYAAARAAELADRPLYAATGLVSGHTLKHLLAAGIGACLWWMLRTRRHAPRRHG
jgi:hypothetical protein